MASIPIFRISVEIGVPKNVAVQSKIFKKIRKGGYDINSWNCN